MLKDLKEGLSSSRKADTTHIRRSFQIYTCRPCEYGSDKYERANFMRRLHDGAEPTAADFERFRKYLRAARDHIDECLESMERHQSQDPKLADVNGMKMAAYAIDVDVTPGSKIGASRLPHVAPACASLMMAITQATDCGLLPKDPGTPWRNAAPVVKTRDSNGFDNEAHIEMRKDPQTGYIVPASSLEEALKNLPDVDVQAKTSIDFPKRREPNQ